MTTFINASAEQQQENYELSTPYCGFSQLTGDKRTIFISLERDQNLSEAGKAVLKDRYLTENEVSPQESLARVACAFSDDSAHAQRLYDYVSHNWFMFATPVLANGGTQRGLPISCYVSQIGDSVESIAEHYHENMFLAVKGGGIGVDVSLLRSKGTKTSTGNYTPGIIPFLKVIDSQMLASVQGSTRRGAAAVYLDISHPEIEEFIEMRKPTGDASRRSHNLNHAVNIPDAFMYAVESGEFWDLIDPHTKEVKKSVDARTLWMKILKTRIETGEPYLFFKDTANNALPQHLKDRGLQINSTQLCAEIMLPTTPERTAVCCLSSLNLEHYNEWKNTNIVEDVMRMLDNVLSVFIAQAPDAFHKAKFSAQRERSVGLGAMGFHLFLQKNGVPFGGVMAAVRNRQIFEHIKTKTEEANYRLGKERGEAPDAEGTGKRFSLTQAVAPNASIAIICGNTSPSIEPYVSNAFTQKTHSGVFLVKNKELDKVLKERYKLSGVELDKVWDSVILNKGSVQHLDFLSDPHKELFRTAFEIDQGWIVEHAAERQKFIDQGQSVNLFVQPDIDEASLHALHKAAWKKGLKSLYYCRSKSVGAAAAISKDPLGCMSCEG